MKRVVIAAGGTGGHLFPAQALARDWDGPVLFLGKGLSTTPFFHRSLFAYQEIASSSLRLKSPFHSVKELLKGVFQAIRALRAFRPDVVVGFGSFHSAPVLVAAIFCRIPIVLFESNAIAGKVNRFFSYFAKVTAVQLAGAKKQLKGKSALVQIPFWSSKEGTCQEAFAYFGLKPDLPVFLVFGGSQGAQAINQAFLQALPFPIQVIHCIGAKASLQEVQNTYEQLGIKACVKPFEEHMHLAWKIADCAICRAGAATLAELIHFAVPSILIPYPYAADNHQHKNALFLTQEVQGALLLQESELSSLKECVTKILSLLPFYKKNLQSYSTNTLPRLQDLIISHI